MLIWSRITRPLLVNTYWIQGKITKHFKDNNETEADNYLKLFKVCIWANVIEELGNGTIKYSHELLQITSYELFASASKIRTEI